MESLKVFLEKWTNLFKFYSLLNYIMQKYSTDKKILYDFSKMMTVTQISWYTCLPNGEIISFFTFEVPFFQSTNLFSLFSNFVSSDKVQKAFFFYHVY